MKNIDLLKAMNDIDDKYIEEAMPLAYKKEKHFGILRYLPAFFGLVLIAVVGVKLFNASIDIQDNDVTIANPNVEYQTLQEAQGAIGFDFNIDLSGFDNLTYTVINNEILDISYSNDDDYLICRKSKGSEDNSGDFNTYDKVSDVVVNETDVTISSSENKMLITFIYEDYSYSFSSNYLSEDQLLNLVKQIIQ